LKPRHENDNSQSFLYLLEIGIHLQAGEYYLVCIHNSEPKADILKEGKKEITSRALEAHLETESKKNKIKRYHRLIITYRENVL